MDILCEKYDIRTKDCMYRLEDIAENIICSKNVKKYCANTKSKVLVDDSYYVTEDVMKMIINKGNCKKARAVRKEIRKIECNIDFTNKDMSIIDIRNNLFVFMGEMIEIIKDVDGDVWFKASDAARILEYDTYDKIARTFVSKKHRISYKDISIPGTPSDLEGFPGMTSSTKEKIKPHVMFVSEAGLYALVMRSKMKKALQFQDWVVSEVLPSIRKHGMYIESKKDVSSIQLVDISYYERKHCVYIANVGEGYYKFGRSSGLRKRITDHIRNYDKFVINKVYAFDKHFNAMRLEKYIKTICRRHKTLSTDKRNKLTRTSKENELYKPNEKFTLDDLLEITDKYSISLKCDNVEDDPDDEKFNMDNLKLNISPINNKELFDMRMKFIDKLLDKDIDAEKIKVMRVIFDDYTDEYYKCSNKGKKVIKDKPVPKSVKSRRVNTNRCVNCKKFINYQSTRCKSCGANKRYEGVISKRPSVKTLKREVKETSYVAVGKKYGVSDNCIRKWIKKGE